MPPGGEPLDPALILDDWINRVANLPEEIRFLQDEIADRDAKYNECIKIIEERDARLQKFIKANGSHEPNPREEGYRKTIVENYDKAEKFADEKIQLAQRMQAAMDRHVRQLDMQLKQLYDRNEPGFTDPDELPSLLRPNSAHPSTPSIRPSAISSSNGGYHGSMNGSHRESTPAAVHSAATVAASGGGTPSGSGRGASHLANRQAHTQQGHSSSAPASPAASMILGRQAREGSAGPGGPGKRGPRINSSLSNIPTTSSGLARHSSLGPGTPKSHQTAQGIQRAGSAGPRATTKGTGLGLGRKSGTPSASSGLVAAAAGVVAGSGPGRKKGNGANGGPASKTLSRVKRPAKHSAASSTAESELSEADSASDSNASSRRGTPVRSSSHGGGGPGGGPGAAGGGSNGNAGGTGGGGGGEKEGSSQPQMKRERDSLGGMPGVSGMGGGSGAGSTAGAGGHGTGPGSGGGHGGAGGGGAALTKHAPRGAGGMAPSSDDRMDVDDDEAGDDRKYCLCQNVSFGDMVACDNDDCPFEWFHWSCVGLKSEPNGAWFCPVCTEKMKGSGNGPGSGGGVPATTRKAK